MTSRSFTVLVIDDDPDVREVIAALLEAEWHVPVQAANGSEGLASARAQHPDLIPLDL